MWLALCDNLSYSTAMHFNQRDNQNAQDGYAKLT